MATRNIMFNKAGGTAGKNSFTYKVNLPADMIRKLGVTPEDRSVSVEYKNGKIIIQKEKSS